MQHDRRFCTSCGQQLGVGTAFCTECGSPQASTDDTVVMAPTVPMAPSGMGTTRPARTGSGRAGLWLAAALVVVLAAGAAGGTAWWLRRDGGPSATSTTASPRSDSPDPEAPTPSEVVATASSSEADGSASPSSSAVPTPTADSVEATGAAPGTSTDPLGLGTTIGNIGCTGEYLVVLASSGTPREWVPTLRPAMAQPGSRYLVTDRSCGSFVQRLDGHRVYAAYLGPFEDLASACLALEQAGWTGGYARRLAIDVASRSVCGCYTLLDRPRLTRDLDEETTSTSRARAVSDVQVLLARAGYNTENAFGGSFGPLTEGWVRALQRDSGLRVTGTVTPGTWRELLAYCGPEDA